MNELQQRIEDFEADKKFQREVHDDAENCLIELDLQINVAQQCITQIGVDPAKAAKSFAVIIETLEKSIGTLQKDRDAIRDQIRGLEVRRVRVITQLNSLLNQLDTLQKALGEAEKAKHVQKETP